MEPLPCRCQLLPAKKRPQRPPTRNWRRSTERGILQLLSLFLFVSMWCYVYYSSKMWSTVAVLVAGYGVYPLMVPCDDLNEVRESLVLSTIS